MFECDEGNFTHRLSRATRREVYFNDESLMNMFDEDIQKEIEIWKVKVSVETV
jgi:aromatic ring-opening dioxygenase catalytic subunit (LigB family)